MAKTVQLKSSKPPPSVAPAAAAPAQLRHGPPLPVGVVMKAPNSMTPLEQAQLTAVGWEPGKPITPEMQAAMTEARRDVAAASNILPVSPDTPPVELKTVDISQLPADQQNKYRQNINEAVNASPPAVPVPPPAQLSPVAQKIAEAKPLQVDYGNPERPATQAIPDPNYKFDPASTPKQAAVIEAIAPLPNCPHCGWDLSKPDIPEPSAQDKRAFMVTYVLGDGKPYLRTYRLMNGALELTFRTLTIRETDAIYRQADKDRAKGLVLSNVDWVEKVSRYRLYLQLYRIKSMHKDNDLPDGLNKLVNPHCEATWECDADETEPLARIEEHILENVLTTESICRIAQQTCHQFNRLTAALEAQVSNDSFWPATE